MEREKGFEPSTSTLARSHSTAELFPHRFKSAGSYKTPPTLSRLDDFALRSDAPRTLKTPVLPLILALAACGPTEKESAALAVKAYVADEIGGMCSAAHALQGAASVADMQAEWKKMRDSYQHISGIVAPMYPALIAGMNGLYEDGTGTGMHAIERVLWAGQISDEVVAYESTLPNVAAAELPVLTQQLIDDCESMQGKFRGATLDANKAFAGVSGAVHQQRDKVALDNSAREESRYARSTLAEMRANLEGATRVYSSFQTLVRARTDGALIDEQIQTGFRNMKETYESAGADALPPVPANFNPAAPTPEQLDTAFGRLFNKLSVEADNKQPMSLATRVDSAAALLVQ
jgi:iron uptake system component EfeO